MYTLARMFLTAAVLLYGYCAVLLVLLASPYSWWFLLFMGVVGLRRRRRSIALDTHGTAAFADEDDLRAGQMIDGRRGLILGRLAGVGRLGLGTGVKALFDGRVAAELACQKFFRALTGRIPAPVVRMPPQVVNSVCFAPVGVGKSSGLVIPFLLTTNESCVVLDFSGELALATAEARSRMGQEIVILDPYKVVTS